jgi:hypothetical protein
METQQMMELLLARMDASQADRNADQERMEADIKSDRGDLERMMEERMNANQTEMRFTVCAIRAELGEKLWTATRTSTG